MLWINFLHLYQPVNTDAHIIKEATEMSYKRIIKALKENPHIKFTFNINGSLILRWENLGYQELIDDIKLLIDRKQIELCGTACYHPLLPLIPEKEIIAQIKENEALQKKFFGQDFKAKGFFMPEMAYSKEVARVIAGLGYEWIILDEISKEGALHNSDIDKIYTIKDIDLNVIFRSRKDSSTFVPNLIQKNIATGKTIITATDGELYGLRHIDQSGEFETLLGHTELKTCTISEYIKNFDTKDECDPVASSWESTPDELKNHKPYALWNDENNIIQTKLWKLANLAYATSEKYSDDENYHWSRWHLVRGFASCTFWWASGKDFSHIFGPHAWNPDEIERGMNEFIRSIRAIENVASRETKMAAEKLFIEIKQLIWEKHWTHWKNIPAKLSE